VTEIRVAYSLLPSRIDKVIWKRQEGRERTKTIEVVQLLKEMSTLSYCLPVQQWFIFPCSTEPRPITIAKCFKTTSMASFRHKSHVPSFSCEIRFPAPALTPLPYPSSLSVQPCKVPRYLLAYENKSRPITNTVFCGSGANRGDHTGVDDRQYPECHRA
jgi:hypothetical protein